ncbi:hypothetical protein ISS85_04695 [Candidatus Microgenomates bacterium]|nr:hypothetical protein [Candidatus Microgenomates bacterium]
MKKIQWKKVLLAGIAYLVIATVVHQIEALLTMNYYMMPEYFGAWSKVMMPSAGPPPMSFMVISLVFSYVTGVTLAAVYDFIKDLLPKKFWPRVINFSDLIIGLMVVFFILPVYLLLNVPLGLLLSWLASSVLIIILGTMVLVKVLK